MNDQFNIQATDYADMFETKGITSDQKPQAVSYTLTDDEKAVAELFISTWESYKTSSEGKANVANLKSSPIEEIQLGIKDICQGPLFKSCWDAFQDMDLGTLKSISLGFSGTIAVLGGFTVGVGVVFDIKDPLKMEVYVTGGALFGADAEVDLAEEAGFWNVDYDDFGGKAYGVILAGEEVGGFAVGLFASSLNVLTSITGFSVGLAEGEGIEISACVSYTILLEPQDSLRTVYQFPKSHFLILTKLVCNHVSGDGLGDEDEVYFTFCADQDKTYYFPKTNYYSMKDSGEFDTWNCGRSVWFNNSVYIEVFDQDDESSDDLLATGTINFSDLPSNGSEVAFDLTQEDDDASYTIYAKLVQT